MITGSKRTPLTKEEILRRCTDFDIYRFYIGPFTPNRAMVNAFRGEEHSSLVIGYKSGDSLTHKDFGDSSWRGDCFSLVQSIYKCDYNQALRHIDEDLHLGILKGKNDSASIIQWKQPEYRPKQYPLIQVVTGKFTKEQLKYWEQFYQGEEDLKREHIYAPKTIFVNRRRIPKGDMSFGYYCPDIEKWKIYRPYGEKRAKDTPIEKWKWMSNIPFDYMEGKWNLAECGTAIITKSRKDMLVLRKALGITCVASIQAEDPACMTDDNIDFIKRNSDIQVIVSDNDKKGKELSWWLTTDHGFRHCNVPYDLKDKEGEIIKDFADYTRVYGMEKTKEYFIKKQIII